MGRLPNMPRRDSFHMLVLLLLQSPKLSTVPQLLMPPLLLSLSKPMDNKWYTLGSTDQFTTALASVKPKLIPNTSSATPMLLDFHTTTTFIIWCLWCILWIDRIHSPTHHLQRYSSSLQT